MSLETSKRRGLVSAASLMFAAGSLVAETAPAPGYMGIGFSVDPESGVLTVRPPLLASQNELALRCADGEGRLEVTSPGLLDSDP